MKEFPEGYRKNVAVIVNARFIKSDIYGTRATTIITIDKDNKCYISERVFDNEGFVEENIFKFTIKNERVS